MYHVQTCVLKIVITQLHVVKGVLEMYDAPDMLFLVLTNYTLSVLILILDYFYRLKSNNHLVSYAGFILCPAGITLSIMEVSYSTTTNLRCLNYHCPCAGHAYQQKVMYQ